MLPAIPLIIGAVLLAGVALTIVACVTVHMLKKFRTRANSTIVATDMKEMIRQIHKNGKRVSFSDLEKMEKQAAKSPIIYAEYDEGTNEVVKVEGAKKADSNIASCLEQNEGVIIISD